MGKPLSDLMEVLFRQIHPSQFTNGLPASDRFRPQPRDEGYMSVDRGALTTAAASHALFTSTGRQSAAVFGVSVGEFEAEALQCLEDPIEAKDDLPGNAAHAIVQYNKADEGKWKIISKRLCTKAIARGRLHPPD
jgi:hypothetical protein